MSKIAGGLAAIMLVATATPAAADVFMFSGNTAGGPTFNRTLAGAPPASLSGVGTAVAYNTLTFTADVAGTYNFLMTSVTAGYDPFLALYLGSFNPGAALTNVLVANDDLGDFQHSGFTRALTTGQTYVAVLTGFNNTDFGAYNLTISGLGAIAAGVPEPAAWALMIIGLGLGGALLRRRRAATA